MVILFEMLGEYILDGFKLAIIVGAVKGLNEEKGNAVARFGLKLLYGATLVSILSSIVSLIL